MTTTVAAIDCGTNSTRVLVADAATGETLVRRNTITRLGQDVDRTGRLAAEAIDRVAATLEDYRRDLDEHDVTDVRVIATSAARDAANRDDFFDRAQQIVGVRPELLDGNTEGRLSFTGATRELDAGRGPYLVVDIGGGSTEFVLGDGHGHVRAAESVDIGSVRMT